MWLKYSSLSVNNHEKCLIQGLENIFDAGKTVVKEDLFVENYHAPSAHCFLFLTKLNFL
jgi:hypothetical protein